MSIREIWTQAHFAELAYLRIKPELGTDIVFPSIYSFLVHSAMVSKMLMASDDNNPSSKIGMILKVPESSIIHNRKFRDYLEHYYNYLKKWIKENSPNSNIGTYNIGPKSAVVIPDMIFVSHYDPSTNIYTFVNEDFDLTQLYEEVISIKMLADSWVKQFRDKNIE